MLEILKYPNPRLNLVSTKVEIFDEKLGHFLDEMAETMYAANGVGLAAPQVGRTERFFIIDISPEGDGVRKIHEFINPVLSEGEGKKVFEEGCLSVPGISEEVTRKAKIRVDYQDRFGKSHALIAEGLFAVALQHENDHLDGVLFVERLSPLKRRFVKRKLSKVVTL